MEHAVLSRNAKPKLKLLVGGATHFLRWEVPYWEHHFELVTEPSPDVVLLVFGPDVLESASRLPARRRVVVLFPGFGCNPYHNLEYRRRALERIENAFDLVFINPGPLQLAYASSRKLVQYPFSINLDLLPKGRYRRALDSLLHVSADYPQKDWQRSAQVMELTGLRCQVFPPRTAQKPSQWYLMRHRANRVCARVGLPRPFQLLSWPYHDHATVIRKYQAYDGFVHIAAEVPNPLYLDGKYTATLLEAGATGALLFWHDTFQLGNNLETVFALDKEPAAAARQILDIRASIDVARHSRLTSEEIRDKFNPELSVGLRAEKILELL